MHGFYLQGSEKAFLSTRKAASLSGAQEWRLPATVFVLLLLSVSFLMTPRQALALSRSAHTPMMPAYNCPGTTHCYGINDWPGSTTGAFSQISVVQLHAGNGIMNNSVWVSTTSNNHWIEAGYAVIYNKSFEFWYWAYVDDSGVYHEYDSGGLAQGDWNRAANVTIWHVSGNTWNASIYGNATSWLPGGFTYSNSPNDINIGQEVGGTSGSSASTATWNDNQWRNSSGTYHYQTSSGSIIANNPPYAGWYSMPSSGYGGDFYAYCC